MATSTINRVAAGTIFGMALTASGVFSPDVILSQMNFQDFHMLQAFLTASGVSAIAMVVAKRLRVSQCNPRSPSTLNWFALYDGNIIGGALLGMGMTLTGACPGTVLVQVALRIRSGYFAFAGGIIGGFVYPILAPTFQRSRKRASSISSEKMAIKEPETIHARFHIQESYAVMAFDATCLAIVSLAASLKSPRTDTLLQPIIGGLFIGGAQLSSLLLTGTAVGVSAAYEQLGDQARYLLSSRERQAPQLGSMFFGAGILIGSFVLSHLVALPAYESRYAIGNGSAFFGGLIMVFGARIAGGCTSGHGISGLSTLSISSFLTVAAIFAGGMGLAA